MNSPLPPDQLHGADASNNLQSLPISAHIYAIRHPTLGFPELLLSGQPCRVVLSLPAGQDPNTVGLTLTDRHRGHGDVHLSPLGPAASLGLSPDGQREAWLIALPTDGVPPALYDLVINRGGERETQLNSVRVYTADHREQMIVLSGDSQYHGLNGGCLQRWVDRLNAREDVDWVALIGDVCDNDVQGPRHLLQLSARIGPGPVVHHYATEYPEAHAILSTLRHPVVLVPGNHDGMVAYEQYAPGPDASSRIAYDGLNHFRMTFGPLHFCFDWLGTRYLAMNSFDLPRHARLGYHAVVSNWGGSVGEAQTDWLEGALAEADALGLNKVMLIHHDPRGGSKGASLGKYHDLRPFTLSRPTDVLKDYLAYFLKHGRGRWQQEWMRQPGQTGNPAARLLSLITLHEVRAVIMGHDNLNWFERYGPGDDLFLPQEPDVVHYRADALPEALEARASAASTALNLGDPAGALDAVEGLSDADAALVLSAATERGAPISFGANDEDEQDRWRPEITAPIAFLHVDDIGAYAYDTEAQMAEFGYVEARTHGGTPTEIRAINLSDRPPGAWTRLPGPDAP